MKLASILILMSAVCMAQEAKRPRVLGDAHIAIYVSDLHQARAFYKDFLGYAEPYTLKAKGTDTDRIVFIKINKTCVKDKATS